MADLLKPTKKPWRRAGTWVNALLLVLIGVVPIAAWFQGHIFWIDIFTRLVILAMAAISLNLILGQAGLVSFGHAVYLGIGAYCVGIPVYHATYGGYDSIASYAGVLHFSLAIIVSAGYGFLTGLICLRTRGVHFIMITMAFSQMIYYLLVSLEEYGADDGLTIDLRSEFAWINLDDPIALYGLCYVSMLVFLYLMYRVNGSRFGRLLIGIKQNEERARALGYNTFRYKLFVFTLAGAMCGYAGALMANFSTFISPSMIEWTRSGELMFMVILGGVAALFGPVIGAVVFVLLEYFLSGWTEFWHLPFGLLLIGTVMLFRGGISGLLSGRTS